jgi:hypothetical protein
VAVTTQVPPSVFEQLAQPPPLLRFSTSDWPERDRLEAVREILGHADMKPDIEHLPYHPLRADVTLRVLPDLHLCESYTSGIRCRRTPT